MFFLLIDYIMSVAISMSISMGAWVVYKTAGGVYYSAKWLMGGIPQKITEKELLELNGEPVIIITEDEYLKLISHDYINKIYDINIKFQHKLTKEYITSDEYLSKYNMNYDI